MTFGYFLYHDTRDCRRYFEEISDIGRRRNDNRHRLSIDGKIGKIADISEKYRWNTDLSEKNCEWIWRAEQPEENLKKSPKISPIFRYFYRFFGKFPDIFYQSSPHTQDTKSGSKIVDLGFVKFKSNGTTTKRPLKQIQKSQGAKEKQIFWFSLGVLHGFCRQSTEDEFSQ